MTYSMYINLFSKAFDFWNTRRVLEMPVKVERLRYCNAKVYTYSDIIVLQSYNSIVAWYDINRKVLFVYNYYSPTTQQHICKFMHDYCKGMHTRLNGYTNSRGIIAYSDNNIYRRKGKSDTIYIQYPSGLKSDNFIVLDYYLNNLYEKQLDAVCT